MDDTKVCNRCDLSKIGIRMGRIYRDEKGRSWKEGMCPECILEKIEIKKEQLEAHRTGRRRCIDCKKMIPYHPCTGRIGFEDDRGRKWNGKRCSDCNYDRNVSKNITVKVKVYRSPRLQLRMYDENGKKKKKKGRYCRQCKEALPPDKYFYHTGCGAQTEYADDFVIFC